MIRALEQFFSYIYSWPERLVDGVGMYRTVTIASVALLVMSLGAGAIDWLAYTPLEQLVALGMALVVAIGLNVLGGWLWGVAANHESAVITALILFFLFVPALEWQDNWPLVAATALAIASKYLIAYRRQHIFNPAASGMVLLVFITLLIGLFTGETYNTDIFQWWIANPTLFWPLLIIGSLVVIKIRRWTPVLACIGVGLLVFVAEGWFRFEADLWSSTVLFFTSFPVLFLAFFMLTEPFTMPPTWRTQAVYGGLVGALSSTLIFAPYGIGMTPELALVIGNCFAYTFRIRQKLYLTLLRAEEVAAGTWELVFTKPASFTFTAGQYLEWMLPHAKPDTRGLRRYFTIASAPEESELRLAVRVAPTGGSTYKGALMGLKPGDTIIASQLAGDFLLPTDAATKLAFVAGGIGVTPFRSHLAHIQAAAETRDVTLYYCNNTAAEIAYQPFFADVAASDEITTVHVLSKEEKPGYESGYLTADIIQKHTPDYKERTWYLSGPPGMVNAYSTLLRELGVPRRQIKQDFFPGLA